jgi:hypothetical protein
MEFECRPPRRRLMEHPKRGKAQLRHCKSAPVGPSARFSLEYPEPPICLRNVTFGQIAVKIAFVVSVLRNSSAVDALVVDGPGSGGRGAKVGPTGGAGQAAGPPGNERAGSMVFGSGLEIRGGRYWD